MKTKLVYVLTSDEKDYYLEQTLTSVYSCRLHNPDAHIALVTDDLTLKTCEEGLRKEFLTYFDEIINADTSAYSEKKIRSRVLKTTLRQQIAGDYLYIDSDTIVCESLAEIDNLESDIAMVPDLHDNKDYWQQNYGGYMYPYVHRYLKGEYYYNSGVMYVKDCDKTHEFYRQWHEQWRKMGATGLKTHLDQPSLNWIISEHNYKIETLDGIWNCQIASNGLRYLHRAKILHFFTSTKDDNYILFADNNLYREIKTEQKLPDHIINHIHNAKGAFICHARIYGTQDYNMRNSKGVFRTMFMYHNSTLLYKMICGFSKVMMLLYVITRRNQIK